MRRSLILSAFFTLLSLQSLLSFALVTTQNWELLDKRDDYRVKDSTYRRNSMLHPYAYNFHPSGHVTRQPIPVEQRVAYNKQKLQMKGTDADHIFEGQMYTHHVENVLGTSHRSLPQTLRDSVRRIINGKKNVAPVPAYPNRSKGQMVKAGMKGKPLKTLPPVTRHYSIASYPAASGTAQELQHAFQQHGYGHGRPTFEDTLHQTYVNAQVLHPTPGTRYQQIGPNQYAYTPKPGTHAFIYPRGIQDISAHDSGSRRA